MVLDQSNVKAGFPAELDVGTGKEVECRLLQTALYNEELASREIIV